IKKPGSVEKYPFRLPNSKFICRFLKLFRIVYQVKSFHTQHSRSGMMPVSSSRTSVVETVDDDIRFKFSNGINHFFQNTVFIPKSKSFCRVFTKSKIIGACKKLFAAINFPSFQKFLSADNSEKFTQFRPD